MVARWDYSVQQLPWLNLKRTRQLLKHSNGWIARATLQVAHIGPVDASFVGKLLLAPALFPSEPPYVAAEALQNVHRLKRGSM